MKPITFKGANTVFAKDQPEYIPLPAKVEADGVVLTCWKMSWMERLWCLLIGRVFVSVMTFGKPLQPLKVEALRAEGDGGRK